MNRKSIDTLKRMVDKLFPVSRDESTAVPPDQVPGHLISAMILLTTQDDVLADVFPPNGSVNPKALYDAGVDPKIVTPPLVARLLPYRDTFATMQIAWLDLADYTDPPCLDRKRMRQIVDFTKTLKP